MKRAKAESNREKRRLEYKPSNVKVLYIAESPPSRNTFFYEHNSILFKYVFTSYENIFRKKCGEGKEFLQFFKNIGCYLDDLYHEPIIKKKGIAEIKVLDAEIMQLAKTIKELKPIAIVILLKRIERLVLRAIIKSKFHVEHIFVTPFPSGNQRNIDNCIKENTAILKHLLKDGVL